MWHVYVSVILGTLVALFACLVRMVERAERAAERAEAAARHINPEFVLVHSDHDYTIMRMAARWGSDVLDAVANGIPGGEAVRRAVPRLHRVPEDRPWDTGSEASTDELPASHICDPNDWVARASQSVTPVHDSSNSWMFRDGICATNVHSASTIRRPVASRPARSPTHE